MSADEESDIFCEDFHCEPHHANNELFKMDNKKQEMPPNHISEHKSFDSSNVSIDTYDNDVDNDVSFCEDPLGNDICDVKDFSCEVDANISREMSVSDRVVDVDTLADTSGEYYERKKEISSPFDKMDATPTKSKESTVTSLQHVATGTRRSLRKVGGNGVFNGGGALEKAKQESYDSSNVSIDTYDNDVDNDVSFCEDPLGNDICDVKDFSCCEVDANISREMSVSNRDVDVDTLADTSGEYYERKKEISSPLDKMDTIPTKSNESAVTSLRHVATGTRRSLRKVGGNGVFNCGGALEKVKQENANKIYSCNLCNKSYAWQRSLRKHHIQVHVKKFFIHCDVCQKKFRDEVSLDDHRKMFHRKCFKCNVCSKVYSWEASLRRHMQHNHKDASLEDPDEEFPCHLCVKTFSSKDRLRRHWKEAHKLLLRHSCEICHLDFQKVSSLKEHLKHHKISDDVPVVYICEDEPSNDATTQSDGIYDDPVSVHDDYNMDVSHDSLNVDDLDKKIDQQCSINVSDHHSDNIDCDSAISKDYSDDTICDDPVKTHGNSISNDSFTGDDSFRISIENVVSLKDNEDVKSEPIDSVGEKSKNLDEDATSVPENTESNDQSIHCKLCGDNLPLGKSLKWHLQNYHEKSYSCPFCDRRFSQKQSLQKHQAQDHPNDFLYCCEQCQRKFRTKTNLRCHMEVHHNKQYDCKICGKIFIWEATLQKHVEDDHKDDHFPIAKTEEVANTEYECPICKNGYQHKSSLTRHLEKVHGSSSCVKCEICQKELQNNESLKVHMKEHMNINDSETMEYSCSYCKETFSDKNGLEEHIKIHTEDGGALCSKCGKECKCCESQKNEEMQQQTKKESVMYLCDICGKEFQNGKGFSRHVRNHTGIKKTYECPFCHNFFRDNARLENHKRKHTGEKPFLCSICGKGYKEKRVLDLHMKIHDGKKDCKCSICGKGFTYANYLTMHMRIHTNERPYSCSVCNKAFTQKSSLNLHMKTHSDEKLYSCILCTKSFSVKHYLSMHMRTHTGEKPFLCSICKKAFSQKSSLNTHMRSCH